VFLLNPSSLRHIKSVVRDRSLNGAAVATSRGVVSVELFRVRPIDSGSRGGGGITEEGITNGSDGDTTGLDMDVVVVVVDEVVDGDDGDVDVVDATFDNGVDGGDNTAFFLFVVTFSSRGL
jgi:hypothetical protein